MTRTLSKPPTDKAMWRKLIARTHPDAGGHHELFIWAKELREHVAGGATEEKRREPPPRRTPESDRPRVPFREDSCFEDLTVRAREMAVNLDSPYFDALTKLHDCRESYRTPLVLEQRRGASYKRLAAIAHKLGMSKPERIQWYRVAESVPLSDRHAGHILSRLNRGTP